MSKVVKNLTLDADAVRKGERFSRKKGTSLSQVVSDLLSRLPGEQATPLSPGVARLLGIAMGKTDERAYHNYLEKKHAK